MFYGIRLLSDLSGKAAGGDDGGVRGVHLLLYPADQIVHLADITVQEAGLKVGDGAAADHPLRQIQLEIWQF